MSNYISKDATAMVSSEGKLLFTFNMKPGVLKKEPNYYLLATKKQGKDNDRKTINNMTDSDGTVRVYLYNAKCEMTPDQITDHESSARGEKRVNRILERYKGNYRLQQRAERAFKEQQEKDKEPSQDEEKQDEENDLGEQSEDEEDNKDSEGEEGEEASETDSEEKNHPAKIIAGKGKNKINITYTT